uniref:Uncharacterized protein n=1 Tax=Rhipicephalus appendiculatus TaxID=34631 RepID=A0A131YEN9_RHIAP
MAKLPSCRIAVFVAAFLFVLAALQNDGQSCASAAPTRRSPARPPVRPGSVPGSPPAQGGGRPRPPQVPADAWRYPPGGNPNHGSNHG